jgi:hypothetical protein
MARWASAKTYSSLRTSAKRHPSTLFCVGSLFDVHLKIRFRYLTCYEVIPQRLGHFSLVLSHYLQMPNGPSSALSRSLGRVVTFGRRVDRRVVRTGLAFYGSVKVARANSWASACDSPKRYHIDIDRKLLLNWRDSLRDI